MDSNLSWKYHISHVESKISSNIGVIARLMHFLRLLPREFFYAKRCNLQFQNEAW